MIYAICEMELTSLVAFCCGIASMTAKEVGLTEQVLESLAQCFSRSPCEVKVCILVCCILTLGNIVVSFSCFYRIYDLLIRTGHSVKFGPAVSHLVCAGFTEI